MKSSRYYKAYRYLSQIRYRSPRITDVTSQAITPQLKGIYLFYKPTLEEFVSMQKDYTLTLNNRQIKLI